MHEDFRWWWLHSWFHIHTFDFKHVQVILVHFWCTFLKIEASLDSFSLQNETDLGHVCMYAFHIGTLTLNMSSSLWGHFVHLSHIGQCLRGVCIIRTFNHLKLTLESLPDFSFSKLVRNSKTAYRREKRPEI